MAKLNWELAGMTNGEGEISRRILPGTLVIPGKIELKGDSLAWEMDIRIGSKHHYRDVVPSSTMLNSFVKLADAPPEAILRFAKKHGVLGLNELGWPGRVIWTERLEPIQGWRRCASAFRSLLNIAAAVKLGNMGDRQDWDNLEIYNGIKETPLRDLSSAQTFVAVYCDAFRTRGHISFLLDRRKTERLWGIEIDFEGLAYNVLVLQLMLTIAGSDLFICDGCQHPYARPREKKRPRQGQANFCDDCGTAVALKQADRRRKQKMAEARRLHAEGAAAGEIAKRLDTKPATVRGWLKKAR